MAGVGDKDFPIYALDAAKSGEDFELFLTAEVIPNIMVKRLALALFIWVLNK